MRGYDFPVNAAWPEIASSLEARTPSIFAPGNPDVFHQVRHSPSLKETLNTCIGDASRSSGTSTWSALCLFKLFTSGPCGSEPSGRKTLSQWTSWQINLVMPLLQSSRRHFVFGLSVCTNICVSCSHDRGLVLNELFIEVCYYYDYYKCVNCFKLIITFLSFLQKFLLTQDFVDGFERQCGSQASVKRLRSHPTYSAFMTKWSLPVYFQLRFESSAALSWLYHQGPLS